MDEPTRLRSLPLDQLAAEMAGVQEGSLAWSKYVAEFKRRAAAQQERASLVAVVGVCVSALAIVAGSVSSIWTDRTVSRSVLQDVSTSCVLPTLPKDRQLTFADLEVAYYERGKALLDCDKSRQIAVELITLPKR